MQDKIHAQAQKKHAQAGAGHARTKGPRKHNTCTRRHGISAKTNRLTNAQIRARYAHAEVRSTCTQEGHAVQAPRQWHWTRCRRCPLSCLLCLRHDLDHVRSCLGLFRCMDESARLYTCRAPPSPGAVQEAYWLADGTLRPPLSSPDPVGSLGVPSSGVPMFVCLFVCINFGLFINC